MFIKKKLSIFLLSFFSFISYFKEVFGEDKVGAKGGFNREWRLEINWPDSVLGTSLVENPNISTLIAYFYEWAITLGIIATFGMMIYASFQYVISSGDIFKLSDSKNKIASALLGMLILFGSGIIIAILNPELSAITDIKISQQPTEIIGDVSNLFSDFIYADNCDYAIVTFHSEEDASYIDHSYTKKVFIKKNETKSINGRIISGIACKENSGFGEDAHNNQVRFIRARSISPGQITLHTKCNIDCAEDPSKSCPPEIRIDADLDKKICYDLREGNIRVEYISQRPAGSQVSCLAGDEIILTGGGCMLYPSEKIVATGCGGKSFPGQPLTGNIEHLGETIECIQILDR